MNKIPALQLPFKLLLIFSRITESDFLTIFLPNTAFGILGALSGPILTTNPSPDPRTILLRIPFVLAWNWLNLLIFDLANQRTPA